MRGTGRKILVTLSLSSNLLTSSLLSSTKLYNPLLTRVSLGFRPPFSTITPITNPTTELDQMFEPMKHSFLLERLSPRHLKDSAKTSQTKSPKEELERESERKSQKKSKGVGSFEELGLSEEVMGAVREMCIEVPTEIQCIGISAMLEGKSVVLGSRTGSGKTLAYMLPLVQLLRRDEALLSMQMKPRRPRAVLLCPTRDLCQQVFRVAKSISHHALFRSTVVSGDGRLRPQEDSLNNPIDMVIGTPGTVLQHIEEGNMVYGDIKYLVLDEVDTMLDLGFGPDIRKFLGPLKNRASKPDGQEFQTVLVSATLTKAMQKLIDEEFQGVHHLSTSTLNKEIASARQDFSKPGPLARAFEEASIYLRVICLSRGAKTKVRWYVIGDDNSSYKRKKNKKQIGKHLKPVFQGEPNPQFWPTCVALGSFIYVLGGYDCFPDNNKNDVFYIDTTHPSDGWKKGPPLLKPRSGACAAVMDGKIYVVNGLEGDMWSEVNPVWGEVFDPDRFEWTHCPRKMTSDTSTSPLPLQQQLVLHDPARALYTYNPQTKEWTLIDQRDFNLETKGVYLDGILYSVDHKLGLRAYDLVDRKWIPNSVRGLEKVWPPFNEFDMYPTISLLHIGNKRFCMIWVESPAYLNEQGLGIHCVKFDIIEKRDHKSGRHVLVAQNVTSSPYVVDGLILDDCLAVPLQERMTVKDVCCIKKENINPYVKKDKVISDSTMRYRFNTNTYSFITALHSMNICYIFPLFLLLSLLVNLSLAFDIG